MFHKKQLDSLLSPLLCPQCRRSSSLTLVTAETPKRGYVHKMEVVCKSCTYRNVQYSSPQIASAETPSRQPFDINHRSVLASREVGIGQPEMVKMLAVMNIKGGLHHKTFHTINHHQVLGKLLHGPAADNLKDAHSIVHSQYEGMYGGTSGPCDISVSFDGTWHIKGHSSTIGECFVIEQIGGLVMDYIVLSKYCAECQLVGEKLEGEEKALWVEAHRDVCGRNHTGSSGSMEMEGAKILWKRSVDVGGFRYTSLVGDGDASVIESVNAIDPYHWVTVVKEECINHVTKRIYKGLESCERGKCRGETEQGRVCSSNNSGRQCLHKPCKEAADKVIGRQGPYDK